MIRYLNFLVVASVLVLASCSNEFDSDCQEAQADVFKTNMLDCSGASIIKYEFEGRDVYAFTDGQCLSDGGVSIIDESCTTICFLGGIAGFTECDGIDFYAEAEQKEVIWEVK